jgi:hypothetical protein
MKGVVVMNCFWIVKIRALRKPPKLQMHLESLLPNRNVSTPKKYRRAPRVFLKFKKLTF